MALMTTLVAGTMAAGLALGGAAAGAQESPAPTPAEWQHRLELACARVAVAIDRVERAQRRIGGDASTRGSLAWLDRRADRLEAAGQNDLAALVRTRITMRTQIADLLPERLEALRSAQQICADAGVAGSGS